MMLQSSLRLGKLALSNSFKSKFREQGVGIHTSTIANRISGHPKGLYEFPKANENFEVSTAEWEYVERLLPMKHIPVPSVKPGTVTPSGWVSPSAKREDYPYFVTRNRSHVLRLFKHNDMVSQKILTRLKGIEGDVFALGKDLQEFLLRETQKRMIFVRVMEPHGVIVVKGDHVKAVERFLIEKGF